MDVNGNAVGCWDVGMDARSARRPVARRFVIAGALVVLTLLALAFAGGPNPLVGAAAANVGSTAESYGDLSFRLQGCDRDVGTTLPNAGGKFICPDAQYSDGNLGKNWNELDLVPHRVLISAGNGPDSTYHFQIEGDNKVLGSPDKIGYDVISAQPENVPAGCNVSFGAQQTRGTGTNNDPVIVYRDVTVTNQQANTTCQIDYYMRLALGAHLWPGSSLHSRLANNIGTSKNIGNKENSIPVNEISPQELSKDMSATQGTDHAWDITKSATPATVGFDNTCDPVSAAGKPVSITVSWEKKAATPDGPITVITHVYATNPAARVITTAVSDDIRSGTTVLNTAGATKDVPANTANYLILSHQTTVPEGTTDLNDVATGTYTDQATGAPIPGHTTATASAPVQLSGPETNGTATINDVESITGAGLKFSADSFSGASGAFDASYVPGFATIGPVSWTSGSQSGTGSVTFAKTIYAASGSTSTGKLSDTAKLTGSDGASASATANVGVSADAKVELTIDKAIPDVLQTGESQDFTFHVKNSNGVEVDTEKLSFGAGDTHKTVIVGKLAPDTYTVSEDSASGWSPQGDQTVDLSDPTKACSGTATFTNKVKPATAAAVKVTNPTGSEGGWDMVLNGPGGSSEAVTTDTSGNAPFTTALQEGHYTITETPKSGWDQTSATGDCDFNVDLPADGGKTFTCTLTNVQRGNIVVKKVTDPASDTTTSFGFGADYNANGFSLKNGESNDSGGLKPGTYKVGETAKAGWDLKSATCDDGSDPSAIKVDAGETVTCTFTNVQRGKIVVKKVTDPKGSPQSFAFGADYNSNGFSLKDGGSNDSGALKPGNYSVSETVPTDWDQTGASCDNGNKPGAITLDPGKTVTCTFTNTQHAHIVIVKNAKPQKGTFTFTTTGSSSGPGTAWPGSFTLAGDLTGNTKSFTVNAGDYSVHEDTQLSWILTGIGGSTDPNTPYSCTVTGTNGTSTGVGDLNTQTVKISIQNGDKVTCVFENTGNGATRTQGFWATHSQLAQIAWFGGTKYGHTFPGVGQITNVPGLGDVKLLPCGRTIETIEKVMGGFWSDVSKKSSGAKRTALDQARMQLLQQLLAAELNASAFGSVPSGGFTSLEAAYCGTNQTAIQTAQQQAGSFNSSGDSATFTPGTSADSKNARAIANKPAWDTLP